MQANWSFIPRLLIGLGIIFLILGAALFGLGLFYYPKEEVTSQQIGIQTGNSIIKFNLSANYSSMVTFNITGVYSIENTTKLIISNQTGAIEYNEPIISFPVETQLYNSSKEYVATFLNLGYSNTTVISVNEKALIETSFFPFASLIIISPFIVLVGSVYLFMGGILTLVKMKKIIKGEDQNLIRFTPIILASAPIVWAYTYLLLKIVLPILARFPNYNFLADTLIQNLIIYSVPTAILTIYLSTVYYFNKVDLKSNFKQIMIIRKVFRYIQIMLLGTIPFFLLTVLNPIFNIGFFAFFVIVIIFFILAPFIYMPYDEGLLIAAFLDFLNELEVKGCEASFDSLKIASKTIVNLFKPFNLGISESCLTSSISYNALVENDTKSIVEIMEYVEKIPTEYGNILPILQDLVSKSDSLEKKGIKAVPSIMDKFGNPFSIIISIISSLVAAIVAIIIKSLFGIGG